MVCAIFSFSFSADVLTLTCRSGALFHKTYRLYAIHPLGE